MVEHDPQTTTSSRYKPGQIWTPTHGRAQAKVIVRIGGKGNVYAARYPRRANVLPSSFPETTWRHWIRETGAQWTGDVE